MFGVSENWKNWEEASYIQKANNFMDSAFQSKKSCGKGVGTYIYIGTMGHVGKMCI